MYYVLNVFFKYYLITFIINYYYYRYYYISDNLDFGNVQCINMNHADLNKK